jgi:hypothetical protein
MPTSHDTLPPHVKDVPDKIKPPPRYVGWMDYSGLAVEDDRHRKTEDIQALERELAGRLAQTPYVLLLSFPGINVVSAAQFGGVAGPMEHYATHRSLTGRAGLRPARYQTNQVDQADGPLLRNCNRALRAAILTIADNLLLCNHHFQHLATTWRRQGKDAHDIHIRVGHHFGRIAFQMVAGGQVFHHPSIQGRHYILDKLTAIHRQHATAMAQVLGDLQAAIAQLPPRQYAAEARPLQEEMERIRGLIRHRGVTPLIYQYGDTVIDPRERRVREASYGTPRHIFKAVSGRRCSPSVHSGSSHFSMALFSW